MPSKILLQLDGDSFASTFDGVVAFDAGVEFLMVRGGVRPANVTSLVHGLMFTRGGNDLKSSAIFVGGSRVDVAEATLAAVTEQFFGPVRVSVMMDANGCNTTAAAAVVVAGKHVPLAGARVLILGATGPVGRRAAQMAGSEGAKLLLSSRSTERVNSCVEALREHNDAEYHDAEYHDAEYNGVEARTLDQTAKIAKDFDPHVVIGAGAAGVELMTLEMLDALPSLRVAVDLNAVPPAGLGGISPNDNAVKITDTAVGYGAIGVGGLKMKVHKAALMRLFDSNDQVLNAAEIYGIAKAM